MWTQPSRQPWKMVSRFNEGTADLEITSIPSRSSSPSPILSFLSPFSGEETWINVAYSPPGRRRVSRNTLARKQYLWWNTQENSGRTGSIPGVSNQEEVAALENHLGLSSTSTTGTIMEYNWTLIEKPNGSEAFIPNGGANRPGFVRLNDFLLPNLLFMAIRLASNHACTLKHCRDKQYG